MSLKLERALHGTVRGVSLSFGQAFGNSRVVISSETVRFSVPPESAIFDQVVELGDRNSKTLGFLPYAGFRDAARQDRIAVALSDDETVLGYCLFDLPRDVVRVVQLCISDAARGKKLARTLIDAVGDRHGDRLGLVLKCRADWPADNMWPRLGFTPQAQVPGRSRRQHPLTVWWRSHGHADLFTLLEQQRAGRVAAFDSNIYSDLHSSKVRHGSKSTAVLAGLIADGQLNMQVLPSLVEEMYATTDASERKRFLNSQVNYARAPLRADEEFVEQLLGGIPEHVLSKDASLKRDAQYIGEAFANGISLFITRDESVLKFLGEKASQLGVDVIRPSDVPTFLDVEESRHAYQPARLHETDFTVRKLHRALTAAEVDLMLDKPGGERSTDFRSLLSDVASRATADVVRRGLFDANGLLWAVWAMHGPSRLEVPLLRIAEGPLQTTLAAQLSRMIRLEAHAIGSAVIRVTDGHAQKGVRTILETDGFYADGDDMVALTVPTVGNWEVVSAAARTAAESHKSEASLRVLDLPEDPSVTQAVEFERLWFPTKILGSGIRNYLVPIKREFATQLLGYPPSLLTRPHDLGLSREHVYYRARGAPLTAPARVLWYVGGKHDPSVVAASKLVEVRVDTPETLHRLFSRLGVWDRSDVGRAALHGRAAAARFTDTELFSNPVSLDRLRALAPQSQTPVLRSASELGEDLFERIYREGRQQ